MKIEEQVVSLELSKELKKLGVPQDSVFYWIGYKNPNDVINWGIASRKEICDDLYKHDGIDYNFRKWLKNSTRVISAPTAGELGEILPRTINKYELKLKKGYKVWFCYYEKEELKTCFELARHIEQANTMANACGEMLKYLLENKLMKL